MKGIEEVARTANFSVILSASHNDPEQELEVIETLHRRRVDGILIAGSRVTHNYLECQPSHIEIPIVLINSQADTQHDLLHWVSIDDSQGAQLAVEHLLNLGHRAIGYLGFGNRPRSNRQRLQGYQRALAAAGIAGPDSWVAVTSATEAALEEDITAGQVLLPTFLEAGVTAVFCYNDLIAIGMLMACQKRGLHVPGELSIVGFDDIYMAGCLTPSLTTIRQPKEQLGSLATQVMLDLLENRQGQNHVLSPVLVERASTAPPAR